MNYLCRLTAFAIFFAFTAACFSQESSPQFRNYDKNNDGKLTRDELSTPLFAELDADKNGEVTHEEDRAFLKRSATAQQPKMPPNVIAELDVPYAATGNPRQRLDIYLPSEFKTGKPRPVVVFVHGGGWQNGSPKQFEQHCLYLASRGIVALTADYRVASRHSVKAVDCVRDAKSAIRWTRTHSSELGIDANRIAAGGGSAGGHLAACTAALVDFDESSEGSAVSSKPNALVLFNPAVALDTFEGGPTLAEKQVESLRERMGVESRLLSPAHHVQSAMPPTIIFFGTNDDLLLGAKFMEQQMRKAGCRIELVTYEGEKHGFFNFGRGDNSKFRDTLARTDQFFISLGWLAGKPGAAE